MNDVPGWEFESAMNEVEILRDEKKKMKARIQELETKLAEQRQQLMILEDYANPGYYMR